MPPELGMLLTEARAQLKAAGLPTPALDARLLLQGAAGLSHEDIIMEPGRDIGERDAGIFRQWIARRLAHEPVSRILGWREFYGRPFRVTGHVLDPRPDTETLVEEALGRLQPGMGILDLGTGSGAIIITLLAERPGTQGLAVDLSREALEVAADNARRHGVQDRLRLVQGSWFQPVEGVFDLVVSNPPYIPAGDIAGLPPDVRGHDPLIALVGGSDGLDAYRAIASKVRRHLAPDGAVLVEIGAGQEADVSAIFATAGFRLVSARHDLGGHVRCLAFVDSAENTHWKSAVSPLNEAR